MSSSVSETANTINRTQQLAVARSCHCPTMLTLSSCPALALRRASPTRAARQRFIAARAVFTKSKPAKTATTKKNAKKPTNISQSGKKLSQEDSMKEMGGIVAQAFGVGIAFPVGLVSVMEASKNVGVDSADAGLYGFMALALGFGVWWVRTNGTWVASCNTS